MKKNIRIIAITGLALLAILTFVSRSIYNKNLPQVTAYKVERAYVPLTYETTAELTFKNEVVIKAAGTWKVSEVLIENGDAVSEGDLLCLFDTRVSDIERMSLELNVMRLTNALKTLYGDYRAETAIALEIAEAQLELFMSQLPPEEGLRAPCDGVVYGLSAKPGDTLWEGTEILTLLPNEASAAQLLKFYLPPREGESFGSDARVQGMLTLMQEDEEGNKTFVRQNLTGKLIQSFMRNGQWECLARLSGVEGQPISGQEVPVKIVQLGEIQEYVVPMGCIFEVANNQKAVYAINTRQGLFGMESYLTEVPVTVNYDNGKLASIESEGLYWNITLAGDPSRWLTRGDVVWVRD